MAENARSKNLKIPSLVNLPKSERAKENLPEREYKLGRLVNRNGNGLKA
jgi:hypothetical protein